MEFATRTVPYKPLVIAPIGDIQWSGKAGSTALDLLKTHIDRCMKMDAWFVGLGDYIDFASPSNRQRLRAAALYDTAQDVIDEKAMELVHELYELVLKPTKGRWLGLLEGHHFTQLQSGETTDMRLCEMLDAKFLGTSAYIRLVVQKPHSRASFPFYIWAHHGCGGGMKAAAPLNKLENILPYWDADFFLLGHMTKRATAPVNRVYPQFHTTGGPRLRHRQIYLVGCGGFSKAYVEGNKSGRVPRGTYVEQKMLNPASLGAPIIKIVPFEKHDRDERLWAPLVSVEA